MDAEETTMTTSSSPLASSPPPPPPPPTSNAAAVIVIRLSDGVRIAGLVLCSISVLVAIVLGGWVIYNRKRSPVVQRMQPLFLLMLCIGCIISSLSIIPLGSNDANTTHVNAACLSWIWLRYLGPTISLSALFSKLWRVNEIFHHAEGFQRKVVTIRDALLPFGILVSMNATLLLVISFVDPPVWQEIPMTLPTTSATTTTTNATTNSTTTTNEYNVYYGQCDHTSLVGKLLDFGLGIVMLIPLIILCIQVYRARSIQREFSEARGVALALFLWLQSVLITVPTEEMIGDQNIDALYTLNVTSMFVQDTSLLFFIFAPLISNHRRQQQRDNNNMSRSMTTSRANHYNNNNNYCSSAAMDYSGKRNTKTWHISGLNNNNNNNNAVNYPPRSSTVAVDPSSVFAFGLQQQQPQQQNAAAAAASVAEGDCEQQPLPLEQSAADGLAKTRISEMELELQVLRSRIQELELGEQQQQQQQQHRVSQLPAAIAHQEMELEDEMKHQKQQQQQEQYEGEEEVA